jgi:hypothetical protein
MMTLRPLAVLSVASLLFAGCSQPGNNSAASSTPAAAPAAAAAPEIVTGKTAFWEMYKSAHAWAPDAEPMRVTLRDLPGYPNKDGKAGEWEAVFGSPSLRSYRTFTYSIVDAPGVSKGVAAGLVMPWGGPTRDAMPIDIASLTVDSDAAYTAAAADATNWIKANPGKGVGALEAGETSRVPDPVWYVMFGTKAAGYAAIVDANSGKVLHK